jgi:hypothetical protein
VGRQVAELAHDELHVPKLVGVGVARHLMRHDRNRDGERVACGVMM